MPPKVVLDSDGLIKLTKAGVLEVLINTWNCLIPKAVYAETVDRGIQFGYPDALTIRKTLRADTVRPRVRDPRATALLGQKRDLGRGEQEALHLMLATRAEAIVTDDAAFVSVLEQAGLRYMPPALALVHLADEGCLDLDAALEALERMRPFIGSEIYGAARTDLQSLRASGAPRTDAGETP